MKKKITIIFLTYNSEKTIFKSFKAASKITKNIIVVDSYSIDKTIKICKKFKCKVYKRKFKNYSDQRNWIINKVNKIDTWQLHLDADEVLDNYAIKSIKEKIKLNQNKSFLIRRIEYFLDKKLNFTGKNQFHLRLFKSKKAFCENKLYDQHFVSKVKTEILNGSIHDNGKENLNDYLNKMKKWAKLEAKDYFLSNKRKHLRGKLTQDPRIKYRFFKKIYYAMPIFLRTILYFIYRLFFRFAFLDGKSGVLFSFYQGFLYRLYVDLEIFRLKKKRF